MRIEGIGLGLRMDLAEAMLSGAPAALRWVEVHPENYMHRGGRYRSLLRRALDRWPVATHGLTMCFGHAERFDREYLDTLRGFLRDVGTPWHSDHMCFGGVDGVFAHDLLPLPFNESSMATLLARFEEAREHLGLELAFENVSYYAASDASETDEVSFTLELLQRSRGKMLLDVNNVYVNSRNFGFDPRAWIDRIPANAVVQIHVAGHLVRADGFRIDTHGEAIADDVYALLEHTLEHVGPRPVLLERDQNFPSFEELSGEVERLGAIYDRAVANHAARTEEGTATGAATGAAAE